MARQENGTMRRCSSCTVEFKAVTLDGTKLVNGDLCPTCEAADRVMVLLNSYRDRGVARGA